MNFRIVALICGMAVSAFAVDPVALPRVYIEPQAGFESYISAAFFKKHVPATLGNEKEGAAFILKSGVIVKQEEKSGLGKLARCAYALCVGIDGTQTVSVELIDTATGQIVWAYNVRKPGAVNYQSSAEAIAKHLKQFFETKPGKKGSRART
jgi:hypothetical protein